MKKFLHSKRKRKLKQLSDIGILNLPRLLRRKNNKHVKIDKKVAVYIDTLASSSVGDSLLEMHQTTDQLTRGEMQIDLTEAAFLKFLIKTIRAKKVLEIGTFRGWSTAVMAEAVFENGISKESRLITMELRQSEADKAQEFWDKYLDLEIKALIDLQVGDAKLLLEKLSSEAESQFDLIFIDANKDGYAEYLSFAKKLIRKGGLIVLDNMLNAGLVATSAKDNTTKHIRKLNSEIFALSEEGETDEFEPYMIPAWDGVVIIRKK